MIDTSTDNRPFTAEAAPVAENDPIAQERAESLPDATDLQTYRRYVSGDQRLCLTEQQLEILAGLLEHRFADNVYKQILLINADRLKVTGFEVGLPYGLGETEGQAEADKVSEFLSEFRIKARFDSEQNKINKAVLHGNHAVGLAWDDATQRVLMFQKPWWDGNTGMYVAYGDNGLPMYAVNEWIARATDAAYTGKASIARRFLDFVSGFLKSDDTKTTTYRYRTIYYPDRIEKYRQAQSAGNAWQQYRPTDSTGREEPWPLPSMKRDGISPLGIPVVHFAVGGDGYYGEPVCPMAVVANQDFLNDTRYDLAGVGRQTGFQRTLLWGFPAEYTNPITQEVTQIEYQTGAGMMYVTENPDAGGTVLAPGDPAGLIKIHDTTLGSMCRMTQTPYYYFDLGSTSGAAILRAEAPLAGKAQEQTESLGPAYAMLMHRATEIFNAKNKAGITLNEDALIVPVWADTSKPDAMAVVEFDKAKAERDRAVMVLEQEKKALEEGRPIYLPMDDLSKRLAAVAPALAGAAE